jgi:hypothetical protein
LLIAMVVQTPLGLTLGEDGLWRLSVLAILIVAGILSTLVPFTLEMVALRTLSIGVFGLLMALEPAAAALAGRVVRAESLTGVQIAGIAFVMVATAGVLGPRWARPSSYARLMRSGDKRVRFLASVPLFDGLSTTEVERIAELMEPRDIEAGSVLTREGEDGDEFFVVEDGAVEIQIEGRSVRTLGQGDFLGEIALVFGGTRTATAIASEPSRVLTLGRDAFEEMLKEQPRVEDKILRVVSERIRYR